MWKVGLLCFVASDIVSFMPCLWVTMRAARAAQLAKRAVTHTRRDCSVCVSHWLTDYKGSIGDRGRFGAVRILINLDTAANVSTQRQRRVISSSYYICTRVCVCERETECVGVGVYITVTSALRLRLSHRRLQSCTTSTALSNLCKYLLCLLLVQVALARWECQSCVHS